MDLWRTWREWFRDGRGGLAVTFAMSLPVLFCCIGLASDYMMLVNIRNELQKAADAAAMAGAQEISVARKDKQQVMSAATSYAAYALTGNSAATPQELEAENYEIAADVVDDFSAVAVDIERYWTPFFAQFIVEGVTPVRVAARARFVGSNNLCVLGLAAKGRAVMLDKNARLTGKDCGVFSNSKDSDGLFANTGATMKADVICSAGGADTSGATTVDPAPVTDCPVITDPLAKRAPPAVGGCDHTDMVITNLIKTINPGVYCGGLTVDGSSEVTLNPGVYVMKDGPLTVSGMASFSGDNVGIFVTGAAAGKVQFGSKTHISLTAPETGPMAGLLIFEDRTIAAKLKHRITSDDARKLIGTIYLPVGDLIVDAKNPVADQSAYTAIIVQHIELNSGPNLVLNSDYELTDVPVPDGIKGVRQVILTQ